MEVARAAALRALIGNLDSVGLTSSVCRYGSGMDAAPLDGRDGADNPGEGERSWRAAVGLVGVLGGLLAVVWLLSLTSDEGIESDAEPVDEEQFEAATTTGPPPEPDVGVEAPSEVRAPERIDPAEPFSPLQGRLMYLSGSDVALLDLATGTVDRVPIEMSGERFELAALQLFTDAKRTVGVSRANGELSAVLVASDARLAPSAHPLVDYWVISRPDGPDGAVQMNAWQDYGILTGELRAPPGSEVVLVRGAGVVVTPPVGKTYRPTLTGFEVASEHRLLAASEQLQVEQRCDEHLSCTVVVDAATNEVTELPQDFVAELAAMSVSPDGRWLLNDTSPAWLFDRQAGQLRLLDGGGYGEPLWSEDSSSVAWLTSDHTPTLVVAQLEPSATDQDWITVELAGLDADPSPGSSFLLDTTVKRT